MGLFSFLFGDKIGIKEDDLLKEIRRDSFSDFFPWVAYDPETRIYINRDDTIGFIWECSPLCFAGSKTESTLEGLLRVGLPMDSVIQFILYADEYIEPYITAYKGFKIRDNKVIKEVTDNFSQFLRKGTAGLSNIAGNPIRNFRLFVAAKMPYNDKTSKEITPHDVSMQIEEVLRGASLYPYPLLPEGLLAWMRRLFNPVVSEGIDVNGNFINELYNNNLPISDQIINSKYSIKKNIASIQIGEHRISDDGTEKFVALRSFKCATPKIFPMNVNIFQTNELFGGVWGVQSDPDQIKTPFLYSLNIIFQDMKTSIHTKCNLVLQQQAVGSFASSLMRKKDEYMWATDEIEKGTKFFRIVPALWVWHNDDKKANESIIKANRIWESQGYVMQEDKGILPILFISALPFGFYNKGKTIDNLDRDFITPSSSVSPIMPVQSDFAGAGSPVMLFAGRKGQLCSLDIYDKGANNHNVFVAATSGSGKSFFVNYLTSNYFAAGAKIRIIDIGGSYKKMTYLFGARFLDFSLGSKICINPFANIKIDDPEDFAGAMSSVASLIHQMAYSATNIVPQDTAETEMSLLKMAVRWAFERILETDNWNGIDFVHAYLDQFPKFSVEYEGRTEEAYTSQLINFARGLAFNIADFTSTGPYGKWFNGPSTFDISSDEFVVLELEHLKPQKELFKVVTFMVIDAVTRDLYLGDRRPTLIVFDEAYQFLGKSGEENNLNLSVLALRDMIEEGYRRARKYNGSFTVITQSILDRKQWGNVGDVINNNSAFKFYLESSDFEKAKKEKLIDYEEFTMMMLKSVKSNKPKYSEIFMDTPYGVGVVRLIVDDYSYYVYTSAANEIEEIESMLDKSLPPDEAYDRAIKRMIQKYKASVNIEAVTAAV